MSWLVDAVIGVVIVVVFWILPLASLPELQTSAVAASAVLAGIVLVAVVLRWRWPLPATATALVATVAGWMVGVTSTDPMLAVAYCLYPLAVQRGSRARVMGLGAIVVIVISAGWLAFTSPDRATVQNAVIGIAAICVSWLLGTAEASRVALVEQSAAQQAEVERMRSQEQTAREIHDVVGHALSVISAEADVARNLPDRSEDELRESLADIEQRARGALEDVQELVRALRDGKHLDAIMLGHASDALPRLVTAAQASGLDMTTNIDIPHISAETGHVLTRVVQEALSNTVRHASASRCDLTVRQEGTSLIVRIDDNGDGLPSPLRPGSGLVGMRERVHAVGGDLTTTNRPNGGTRVLATIPLDAPS